MEPTVEVHITADDLAAQLRADAEAGLTAREKWIPATWFYDEVGSQLFDEITRLAEYYPTRTERAILAEAATAIAELSRAETLIELGSGTSDKTVFLLDALSEVGTLRRFVPFDVSEPTVRAALTSLSRRDPALALHGVIGDFRRHMPELFGATAGAGPRLVAFLGGTIGNLNPDERVRFHKEIAEHLRAGDHVLFGCDLVKDRQRLVAAYDDAGGVTARFNRNVLAVMNRRLGADFPVERFEHVARWSEELRRIEMRLRATQPLDVRVGSLTVHFDEGEELLTEISCKFTEDQFTAELELAGFEVVRTWTDPGNEFLVTLARPG